MRRTHKENDPRCKVTSEFECPTCEDKFTLPSLLENHIKTMHDLSSSMPSLISEADDSLWKYSSCNVCDGKMSWISCIRSANVACIF